VVAYASFVLDLTFPVMDDISKQKDDVTGKCKTRFRVLILLIKEIC